MKPHQEDQRDRARRIIGEEAAQWLFDLREGGPETQAALFAWLKQSPLHVEEFLLASAVWKGLDHVAPNDAQSIERLVAEACASSSDTNVVSLKERPELVSTSIGSSNPDGTTTLASAYNGARRRPMRRSLRIGIGIAATLVLALGAGWALWLISAASDTYVTAVGEQRAIRLPDDSILHLNTRSRVEVRFSEHERNVRLLEGQALFTVQRDPARPFRVSAGSSIIQAVGTQFDVYRQDTGTTVSVLEGIVRISTEPATTALPFRSTQPIEPTQASHAPEQDAALTARTQLRAGEQASIAASGEISKRSQPDVTTVVAWRERRLVFRGETLEEIAAEFNRYTTKQIRVEGYPARNKRLAGTFNADDPESLVSFLTKYEDLVVETVEGGFVIRERAL